MQVSVAVAVDVAFDPSTFLIQSDKPYAYSLAELGYRVRGFKTCGRSESQLRALLRPTKEGASSCELDGEVSHDRGIFVQQRSRG